MKTGGRGSSSCGRPGREKLFPQAAEHRDRRVRPLEHGFRLRRPLPPAAFGRRELRQDPAPDVEVAGDGSAGRVAHGELRDLDEAGLDGIGQREVADDPRKRPVRLASDAAEEVRRGRQIHAEVDAAKLLDAVETVDPHRGFLQERLGLLDAAADRLYQESAAAQQGERPADEVSAAQRRADALGRLAECALAGDLDRGTAGDRYQVVVHVDAPVLQSQSAGAAEDVGQAAIEVADTATYVSSETSRRLTCDASVVVMRHGADGSVLDVGRKTRTIPAALRRALTARDRHCRFPACAARRVEGHHVAHWADGGPTTLGNLVSLCRRHHRALHEGGFQVVRAPDGAFVFFGPDGERLDEAPAPARWCAQETADPLAPTAARLAAAGVTIGPHTTTPCWDGEPFDLGWAIDVLRVDTLTSGPVDPGA
jgi:hypothetical protein